MSYTASYSEDFVEKLVKIRKKYAKMFYSLQKKINEILQNSEHYKPLKYDLHGYRRVHIMGPFVIVFKIEEQTNIVKFMDFDHHDKVYKKRYN